MRVGHHPPSSWIPVLVCSGRPLTGASDESGGNGKSNRATIEGLRILIVEDELLVAMHLEEIAEDLGCEIAAVAPNGRAAIRLCSETKPDVIVMDVNLGKGIDGIEAAAILRETRAVSIIFVTAYRDQRTIERIRTRLPEAAILNKPVSPKELRRALERVIP
ncbi:MAG: hypothetical protein NVS2B5_15050 [Beijerinckiaceae bacterium]